MEKKTIKDRRAYLTDKVNPIQEPLIAELMKKMPDNVVIENKFKYFLDRIHKDVY